MKQIFVIGTYPSTKEREEVLMECIDRLSNKGYDIMVVSHYPIPNYIQSKVEYCIYDKENIFLPTELTPSYWFGTEGCYVEIYNEGHLLTCSKNMFTSLSLVNALNYDFFYYLESDNHLDYDDIVKIDKLKEQMFEENKNMIFFKDVVDNYLTYNTLLFGGKPNYFLKNIPLPLSVNDYIRNLEIFSSADTLERFFYSALSNDENNFTIIEETINSFFNKSKINIISHEHFVEIIGDKNENLYLWVSNGYFNTSPVKVTIDDNEPLLMYPGSWVCLNKNVGDKIKITTEEKGFIYKKEFEITQENKSKFIKKGKIKFT